MRPLTHLGCGTILAAGNYILNKEADTSLGCALGAVLCDTDHIAEYLEYCHKYQVKPDFEEWKSGEYFTKKGTVKVIFHSWEICFVSWLLLWFIRNGRNTCIKHMFKGLLIGYTSHLFLDHVGNGMNWKCYFLSFRWLHKWKQKELG